MFNLTIRIECSMTIEASDLKDPRIYTTILSWHTVGASRDVHGGKQIISQLPAKLCPLLEDGWVTDYVFFSNKVREEMHFVCHSFNR